MDVYDNICVTDYINHRVLNFSLDGQVLHNYTTANPALGSVNGLYVDAQANIFVADGSVVIYSSPITETTALSPSH